MIAGVLLLSCMAFYWYDYVDGTRTGPQLKCSYSMVMGIFIILVSMAGGFIILGTAAIASEMKKRKKQIGLVEKGGREVQK